METKKVKIISDSTCDLSPELVARYDIGIIPLHVLLGEDEYEDGVNIKPDDLYAWADANKTTPKTSAPSFDTIAGVIKPYTDEGRQVIAFCISETMSTCGNAIRIAADELDAEDLVTVYNSKNLSTGIGHLVIAAAILAEEGKSPEEIVAALDELNPKVRASFVVDTLTYLHRGGRCSGLAALAGGALKLHPKISVVDGVMGAGKKYRGAIAKATLDYVKDMEDDLKVARPDRVFITHSGCNPELVGEVRSYLESLDHFDEILETRAGSVVSSHCGPGTLGVLFIAP